MISEVALDGGGVKLKKTQVVFFEQKLKILKFYIKTIKGVKICPISV